MEGRYVNVIIPGHDKILTLCEVEVYASLAGMVLDHCVQWMEINQKQRTSYQILYYVWSGSTANTVASEANCYCCCCNVNEQQIRVLLLLLLFSLSSSLLHQKKWEYNSLIRCGSIPVTLWCFLSGFSFWNQNSPRQLKFQDKPASKKKIYIKHELRQQKPNNIPSLQCQKSLLLLPLLLLLLPPWACSWAAGMWRWWDRGFAGPMLCSTVDVTTGTCLAFTARRNRARWSSCWSVVLSPSQTMSGWDCEGTLTLAF